MTTTINIPTREPQSDEATSSTSQGSSHSTKSNVEPSSLAFQDGFPDDVPKDPVDGWPRAAKMMAGKPEFGNFCRFSDLNTKSLLYYQAELFQLRKRLHKCESDDFRTAKRGSRPSNFFRRADFLVASKNDSTHEQWDVVVRIREVLKEYNGALVQYAELQKLSAPNPYNVESFRIWLASQTARDEHEELGEIPFGGEGEENTWGDLYKTESEPLSLRRRFLLLFWHLIVPKQEPKEDLDLVATNPRREIDFLTRWVMNDYIPFYADLKRKPFFEKLSELYINIIQHIKPNPKEEDPEAGKASPSQMSTPTTPTSPTSPTSQTSTIVNPQVEGEDSNGECSVFEAPTVETYSGSHMLQFTSGVATIIACLLPTVAISVLSKINETGMRLGAIAGFTALFAAGLMGLTDAGTSRVEIFTATAAFSAVMVVFVQNT